MYLLSVRSWVDRDSLQKPAPGDWMSFGGKSLQLKSKFHSFFTPRSSLAYNKHCAAHKRLLFSTTKWPACQRAASGGGARRVSGPALLRTAPALPAPWNPNLRAARHSERNQPITRRAPPSRQHQPRFISMWDARGSGNRWLAKASPVGQWHPAGFVLTNSAVAWCVL